MQMSTHGLGCSLGSLCWEVSFPRWLKKEELWWWALTPSGQIETEDWGWDWEEMGPEAFFSSWVVCPQS